MTDIKNMKQRADDSGYFVTDYIKREDTISRQAAIEAVDECTKLKITDDFYTVYTEDMKDMIADIPTADVRENVKGRWVEVVDRTEMYDKEGVKTWGMLFQCNQCGFVLNAIEGHTGQYNYCPNCGSDMRGEA